MTGEAWRLRREEKGLTLRELARRAGISAPFQSDVEHGRRCYSPEVEARVRSELGMEPSPQGPDAQHRCPVCGGKIIETAHQEYRGDPMHMIIGPGHRNQLTTVRYIYCDDCGVTFRHLPRFAPAPAPRGEEPDQ